MASILASEEFHAVSYDILTPFSMMSNGRLILLHLRTKLDSLGSYRYLILIFAINNIVSSLSHHASQICFLVIDGNLLGYSRFSNQYRSEYGWKGVAAFLSFVITHTNSMLLLALQYLYRLMLLRSGKVSSSVPSHFFLWAVILGILNTMLATVGGMSMLAPDDRSFVSDKVISTAGIDLRDPKIGFCAAIIRNVDLHGVPTLNYPTIAGMSLIIIPTFATSIVIGYCIVKIRNVFKSSWTMSGKTRLMQRILFRTLLIQSAVPCIFSYVPAVFVVVSAVAVGDNNISINASVFIVSTAIFPAVDSVFVIAFIGPYRNTLLACFRSGKALPQQTTIRVSSEKTYHGC